MCGPMWRHNVCRNRAATKCVDSDSAGFVAPVHAIVIHPGRGTPLVFRPFGGELGQQRFQFNDAIKVIRVFTVLGQYSCLRAAETDKDSLLRITIRPFNSEVWVKRTAIPRLASIGMVSASVTETFLELCCLHVVCGNAWRVEGKSPNRHDVWALFLSLKQVRLTKLVRKTFVHGNRGRRIERLRRGGR